MKSIRSYKVTQEEKYALVTALIVFALLIVIVIILNPGSYLEVHQPEITVVISSNPHAPSILFSSLSTTTSPIKVHNGGVYQPRRPVGGFPVPVPDKVSDTSESPVIAGVGSNDTTSTVASGNGKVSQGAIDSLIILYPGFKQFALREEMKKTRPKTRKDSLLAWAKENFNAQMSRYGKIDPTTLNQLMMLQRNQTYGPYHITTPGVGVGVTFDYTEVLKKIISIFEKAPKD